MITASEIRVGNFIQWEDDSNDIVEVLGVYKGEHENTKDDYFVHYKETSREEYGNALIGEFIPIPLTAEWLYKFGFGMNQHLILPSWDIDIGYFESRKEFKKLSLTLQQGNQYIYLREQNNDYPNDRLKDGIVSIFNSDIHGNLHVHKIQNLYYAVTGKELQMQSEIKNCLTQEERDQRDANEEWLRKVDKLGWQ